MQSFFIKLKIPSEVINVYKKCDSNDCNFSCLMNKYMTFYVDRMNFSGKLFQYISYSILFPTIDSDKIWCKIYFSGLFMWIYYQVSQQLFRTLISFTIISKFKTPICQSPVEGSMMQEVKKEKGSRSNNSFLGKTPLSRIRANTTKAMKGDKKTNRNTEFG